MWLGDLNYRIELKREEVLSLTRDRRYGELARYDQLKHQINCFRLKHLMFGVLPTGSL